MPINRYFTDVDLVTNRVLNIQDKEFHHIVNVARITKNESLELINGKGKLASCIVNKIERKSIELTIKSVIVEPELSFEIILAQSIPKTNRLDTILEKTVELGVTKFMFFPGVRSERKSINISRAQAVTVAATKQCGRLWLPEIELAPKLDDWKSLNHRAYFGDISANAPKLLDELSDKQLPTGIIFFVGPESGFTDNEINILKQLGAKGVSLHKNILRTDTASITALALISSIIE